MGNENILNQKVSLLSKIFIYSLIFESLLFFVLGDQNTTGISLSAGKLLQFVVLLLIIGKQLISPQNFKVVNIFNSKYKYFSIYLILAVISGLIGLLNNSYVLIDKYNTSVFSTGASKIIRSSATRPIIEYLILTYNIFYFIILPRYLLVKRSNLIYFFKAFEIVFFINLIVGYIDLTALVFGVELLPRHMFENVHVGFRFHGFAGEPRDAFVYLIFGIGMLSIKSFWLQGSFISKKKIIAFIIALILTQSGSGMMGILFGGLLIIAYGFINMSRKKFKYSIVLILALTVISAISIYTSSRLQGYLAVTSQLYAGLKYGASPPHIFGGQMPNIYPLWDLFSKVLNGNFISLIFGSGLGSSSIINNNLGFFETLTNPHSQIVRLIYECGLIGTIMYIIAFVNPVQILTASLPAKFKQSFIIIILMLIGSSFGHRSTTIFIYIGIFISVFNVYLRGDVKELVQHK